MPIEQGNGFIVVKVNLVDPLESPEVTVSGMSLHAAQNVMHIAANDMWEMLPESRVVLATDKGDVEIFPQFKLDPDEFEDEEA